tara:strand:- start:5713 stop:6315 length:603 start_codon:yes stop_codon:yes gene_type:complete
MLQMEVTTMTMTQSERQDATHEYLFGDAQVNVSNAIRDSFSDGDWTGIREALGKLDANPQGQPAQVSTLRTLIQRNTDKEFTIKKVQAGKDRIFDVVQKTASKAPKTPSITADIEWLEEYGKEAAQRAARVADFMNDKGVVVPQHEGVAGELRLQNWLPRIVVDEEHGYIVTNRLPMLEVFKMTVERVSELVALTFKAKS